MAHHFVAFDLGAESGRAVLGSLDGGRLSLRETHRFPNPTGRMNGHLFWNLLGQWEELKIGLRKSVIAAGSAAIDGIGVDTWGVDYGLLDAGGELMGNPYHYRDARTEGAMAQVFEIVPRKELFERTGLQFLNFNTLFQLFAERRDRPGRLERAATLLFVPDVFNYLFAGVRKCEFSIASTSQMLDPRTGNWAADLLKALALPAHLFPEIVPSGTVLGPLRGEVMSECGCGPIPVIAPACHDTASAVAAVPTELPSGEWCYISSGTWSLMGVELNEPLINAKSLKYNYTNEGGVGGSIRFLKNIMGLWLVQECRRHWLRQGTEYSYPELTRLAGEAPASRHLLNLDHAPFASPGDMPAKIDSYCRATGQSIPRTPGETVRACLDALALTYRATLARLEEMVGRRIAVIHIVGGGGQNELLNQMTADACDRDVVAGPTEATAIGNILVQAMAVGQVRSLADARRIVGASFDVKRYTPRGSAAWTRAYEAFQSLPAAPLL